MPPPPPPPPPPLPPPLLPQRLPFPPPSPPPIDLNTFSLLLKRHIQYVTKKKQNKTILKFPLSMFSRSYSRYLHTELKIALISSRDETLFFRVCTAFSEGSVHSTLGITVGNPQLDKNNNNNLKESIKCIYFATLPQN